MNYEDQTPEGLLREIEALRARTAELETVIASERRRLSLALSAAKAGIWEFNRGTGRVFWSPEIWHQLGLDPGKHRPGPETWLAAVRPDHRSRTGLVLREAVRQNQEISLEWPVDLPEERWLLTRAVPVQDQGHPGYIGVNIDITAKKLAEREITSWARIPEENPHLVLRVDQNRRITLANQASRPFLEHYGVKAGGDFPQALAHHLDQALASGEMAQFEITLGEGTVLALTAKPVPGNAYVNLYGLDVTRRKQAEERSQRMEALLTSMLRNLPLDFWARDAEGNILIQSDICRRNWGDMSSLAEDSARLPRETIRAWQANNAKALAGRSVENEREYAMASGRKTYVREMITPFFRDGHIMGLMGVNVDLTQHKALEQELKQAKDSAERANKAKSQFLANMSHEIRTPMNGVLGMTELAMINCRDPKILEYLELARQSGRALLGIINDILDLSKIEAGKAALTESPFELRELIDSTLRPLALLAGEKGLRFMHAVDSEVPDTLLGDQGRLRQVLTNLAGNAVKFTERGGVAVTVALALPPAPGRVTLLFVVKDTGPGIPRQAQGQIFEPFTQALGSAHAQFGGTGLGLAISRQLVEMMGGAIRVDSTPGQGAAFRFTVALGVQDQAPKAAAQAPAQAAPLSPRLRVLLAEDNPVNRILTVEMLAELGHKVSTAENGRQALDRLKEECFDLVLMDVSMPVMDGLEALNRIRAGQAGAKDMPVVALTAHALKGDRERLIQAGMDDYLAKPVDMAELDRVLERFAQAKAGG